MLPTVDTLNKNILNLPPTGSSSDGSMALANVIGNFMDQIQAGSTGSPGILKFQVSIMANLLAALPPVSDSSWIDGFSSAWEAALSASIIVPGTVSSPAWVTSSVDILTLPSAAASIISVPAAKQVLSSGLKNVSSSGAAKAMAQAIYDASSSLTFMCIGLGPPPTPVPIPMVFPAK